jgi:L-threonylcarbamoyladenylate synthase
VTAGRSSLNRETLERAAGLIRAGELVAFPTETVYGLGANALDPGAVEKIYLAKGRPPTSPVIVHVASLEMAYRLVRSWPPQAQILAERWWPGPLTLVLPKDPVIPGIVTAGLDTVGLRMPAHPMALELIRAAGVPIAAPSANRFTELSPTTAAHVRESLGAAVELILDGGPTTVGIESTVLSLASDRPLLLRPGMVTQNDIEALIGPVQVAGRIENGHPRAHPSPGMHPRHYSPRTPLLLLDGGRLPADGRGAYLCIRRPAPASKSVAMPGNAAAYAAVLYETLHRLDQEGWDWIAVERPPQGPDWAAINDRLQRAASRLSHFVRGKSD